MAKKKSDEPVNNKNMEAQLWGTLSRVHGILGLQGSSMMERYTALNDWCRVNSGGVRCIPVEHDKVLTHE